MARVWMSGFTLSSVSTDVEFSSVTGLASIQTTTTRIGPYAAQFNTAGAAAFIRYHGYALDQNIRGFQRCYFRVGSYPNANTTIMRFANAANDPCAQIRMTNTGALRLLDAGGGQVGSDSSALSLNTWYRIEIDLDASTNPGTVAARINGTQFASGANSAQSPWSRWLVGPAVGVTMNLYAADWAVNDTTGSVQNSFPGDGAVLMMVPNGDGGSHGWADTANAAGTSNNYTLVTSTNDATDFVQTGVLNAEDWYALSQSGTGANDTVNVLMGGLRYRNNTADATAAVRLEMRKVVGGTVVLGPALIPNSATFQTNSNAQPHNYPILLQVDPDGATLTPTTLDMLQLGLKMTAANANRIQVTCVFALFDYTPSTMPAKSPQALGSYGTFF